LGAPQPDPNPERQFGGLADPRPTPAPALRLLVRADSRTCYYAAMSLRLRRTLSWLGTAAIIAVLASTLHRLPGQGGLHAELRWLLDRPPTARTLNQALGLTLLADEQQPGVSPAAWAMLLRDSDPQVVQNALTVLGDKLRTDPECQRRETVEVREVLREWLRETPDPNVPASAAIVFDEVFGPEWRRRFESGNSTSQPSDGHRGG
jgi:hypothetical protein